MEYVKYINIKKLPNYNPKSISNYLNDKFGSFKPFNIAQSEDFVDSNYYSSFSIRSYKKSDDSLLITRLFNKTTSFGNPQTEIVDRDELIISSSNKENIVDFVKELVF